MKMLPWPECPQCRTKRIAVCPFCKTEGNDFPVADIETLTAPELSRNHVFYRADCYSHGLEPDVVHDPNPLALDWMRTLPAGQEEIRLESTDDAAEKTERSECSEHPEHTGCSCSSGKKTSLKLVDPIEALPEVAAEVGEFPLTVQCPVCDEVLLPRFFDTCRTCGYRFEDGIPTPEKSEEDAHGENPGRTLFIFGVLVVLLGILTLALILS